MFGFLKKRLFRRMIGYVDAIKLAVYAKLWPELEEQHDQEQAKQLSAAVVNRLFNEFKFICWMVDSWVLFYLL